MRGVAPRRLVEGPRAPRGHRGRQRQRHPLPSVELQCTDHRHRHHGRGADDGHHQPTSNVDQMCFGGDLHRGFTIVDVGCDRAVTQSFDHRHQMRRVGSGFDPGDGGLRGGVIDRGHHAVELVQLFLDARRTGGARHAGDGQDDRVVSRRWLRIRLHRRLPRSGPTRARRHW